MLLPGGGGSPSAASPGSPQANLPAETMQEAADQMEGGVESRVVGHVKWQVYTAYVKAVGTGLVLFVLLSLALMQASNFVFSPGLSHNRFAKSLGLFPLLSSSCVLSSWMAAWCVVRSKCRRECFFRPESMVTCFYLVHTC